ncbi:MAG: calcium-translocating P-type ATPase, SERCA-type [Burkholderiales bacterium]|nr:calcium-translocating P-type ATPase, SERCA-type [Burkholderiales bacterium]
MQDRESHGKPIDDLVSDFQTNLVQGLTQQEALDRLAKLGANELTERPRPGFLALLWDQFNNYLVIILILAALISLALGEYVDSIAIMFIVVLNAVVGVIQESKAEQALAALQKMSAPNAQVLRDGQQMTIPGREIVGGDIVLLEAGNYVPADLRLVESVNLKIEEASLTGESVPVEKNAAVVLDKEIPLGDRKNTAFMGTVITYGRGKGLVTGTGMNTQIGLIAEMIQSFEAEDTPLQKKLEHLGKVLGTAVLAICALVFIYGLFRDTHLTDALNGGFLNYLEAEKKDIINLFMTAVSLAIAAVPEGLPAIVTICLALGMQRMIKHHALIRKLPAVETLGCATVVCSDKTGTLTQNQMTVVQGWSGGKRFRVTGEGYDPDGQFFTGTDPFDPRTDPDATFLLHGALVCNDARLEEKADESGRRAWQIIGDPTEGAMVVAAAKSGYRRGELEAVLPRIQEIPFDSDRKRMTTIHSVAGEHGRSVLSGLGSAPLIAFVKGAPDVILDLCGQTLESGQAVGLTQQMRAAILEQNRDMAGNALRVLAVAYRPLAEIPASLSPETVETDLVFVGLLGMIDPPRPEVIDALKVARGAGLKSIMVTGDYKDTAEAIARDIGLLTPGGLVLTGAEIEKLSDEELAARADRLDVCCRVSPQHKTRIVEALKARGHVVAMTGDGVNDAPALKRANIGVAMGITGTDVAKQTADMVLTDDNFASIVAAIEQGRIIYSNIRKFVYFLLACNVGEILIIFASMLLGLPIPLRPVQLLWLNLVSDGAPALALGLEKGDPDIMKHPPRSPQEPVINRDMAIGIGVVGVVDAIAILAVFYLALQRYPGELVAAQTIAFVTLCSSELIRAFTARSEYHSIFSIGVFSNRWMVWAVGASFVLVLMVVYLPFLRPFFDTVALSAGDWLLMLPFFFASPIAMELLKVYFRKRKASAIARAAAQLDATIESSSQQSAGGNTMLRILIPVDGSRNCRYAVQQVVKEFMNNTAMEIHLLNVQAPFSREIARFVSRKSLRDHHREQAEKALGPIKQMLDGFGIPYSTHAALGPRAKSIADAARRLRCDRIVMGTARKNSLTRLVENSVTNKVLELTPVPVEVIAGDAVSGLERFGIPAAIGAVAALLMLATD